MPWQVPVGIVVAILLWAILNYNTLVRMRIQVRESWSGIDTELKRRYDLVPNLVEAVKGYAAHERETLQAVVEARNKAISSTGSPQAQAADENVLVGALGKMLALAEKYPDLKAGENFLALQRELSNTEDRIQAARRFYNGNVRELKNLVRRLLISESADDISLQEVEAEVSSTAPDDEPLVKQDLLSLPLREAREQFERAYLQQQLVLCDGKVGQLAKRVGMERTHLYRKLRALGVDFRQAGSGDD